ncbi:MAG: sensor histidine kinase [Rubripirellula sp.]
MSDDIALLKRRFERERAARKEAESLLEQKSREVFYANEELRSLADQLRDQAKQTQAIVDTAAEGIITYGEDGIIQSFNQSAGRIFRCKSAIGVELSHLFDASDESVLYPDQDEHFSLPVDINQDETDLRDPIEVEGRRASGKTFFAEIAVSRIEGKKQTLFTALVRDLSNRKRLEAQLGQAQKMESVGQLAAGIAHEINTPIQFVGDNIQFLEGAFEDLRELLTLYGSLVDTIDREKSKPVLIKQIRQQEEIVDLPFLREEFPDAIEQATEGIGRVSTIVRAMKDFSQPSSEAKSSYNLNKAVESTLAILANQLRDVATIESSLDPDLTPLLCLAGQMNQTLLNIFSNSIEALAEHGKAGEGKITVVSKLVRNSVELKIQDNGPGIPKEIQDRIFDPFFTTKEVGKGMGQGLAFVYDVIVDKHDGSIHVQSSAEAGTTFLLRLPVANVKSKQEPMEKSNASSAN